MAKKQKTVSRQEAIRLGLTKYDGTCKYHGQTKFYTRKFLRSGHCCVCKIKSVREGRQKDPRYKFLLSIKENGICFYCKNKFHPYAMTFDHYKDKKIMLSLSRASSELTRKHYRINAVGMLNKSVSIEDIKKEMKSVRLSCSNCHSIKTRLVDMRKGLYKEEGKKLWRQYLREARTNNSRHKQKDSKRSRPLPGRKSSRL